MSHGPSNKRVKRSYEEPSDSFLLDEKKEKDIEHLVLDGTTATESITTIDDEKDYGSQTLQTVRIVGGSNIKCIGERTFAFCMSLETVQIENGVTKIRNEAFLSCRSLQSIQLPGTLTSIEYSAFMDCKSLQSIHIPHGVKTIATRAFSLLQIVAFYSSSNWCNNYWKGGFLSL